MTTRSYGRLGRVLGLLLLAVSAGCGGGGGGSPPPVTTTEGEYTGMWLTGCEADVEGVSETSRLTAVYITSSGQVDFYEYTWNSAGCDGGIATLTQHVGSLTLPGGAVTTSFGTATKADLNAAEQWLTVFDPDVVGEFNAANDEDGAYCLGPWVQGVPQNVIGRDYDCSSVGTVMRTLFLRFGDTLFIGDDDTIDESGYPAEVRAGVARVPTAVVTAASLQGEWSEPCREEVRSEYASQTAVEWLAIAGNALTLTTTYYQYDYGVSCDPSDATPMAREVVTMTFAMQSSATLLTERGLATAGDFTLAAHTITPLATDAADALNWANFEQGAYHKTDWAVGVLKDVYALGVEFDGETPRVDHLQVAALIRGDELFVRGADDPAKVPRNGAGYPLTVGIGAFLRNYPIANVAEVAGNWYEPCHSGEGWMSGGIMVAGGTITFSQWGYSGRSTCRGGIVWNIDDEYTMALKESVVTDRGTARKVQLQPVEGGPYCALLMRTGDRLHASELYSPEGASCGSGDYASGVRDDYGTRDVSPVAAAPLSVYRGACRWDGDFEMIEVYRFLGEAVAVRTLWFDYSDAGPCTGEIFADYEDSGRLAFGAVMSVDEGDATHVTLSSGEGSEPQIVKWMSDLLWFGDDEGPTDDDGCPMLLIPGYGAVRSY